MSSGHGCTGSSRRGTAHSPELRQREKQKVSEPPETANNYQTSMPLSKRFEFRLRILANWNKHFARPLFNFSHIWNPCPYFTIPSTRPKGTTDLMFYIYTSGPLLPPSERNKSPDNQFKSCCRVHSEVKTVFSYQHHIQSSKHHSLLKFYFYLHSCNSSAYICNAARRNSLPCLLHKSQLITSASLIHFHSVD